MEIVHERAAGMDISKRDAKACLRLPGHRAATYTSTVTTWGASTGQILELREFLEHEHVTTVVMEAPGDYWKKQQIPQSRPGHRGLAPARRRRMLRRPRPRPLHPPGAVKAKNSAIK